MYRSVAEWCARSIIRRLLRDKRSGLTEPEKSLDDSQGLTIIVTKWGKWHIDNAWGAGGLIGHKDYSATTDFVEKSKRGVERTFARKGKENFVFKKLLLTIQRCFIESDAGSITRNSVTLKNSPWGRLQGIALLRRIRPLWYSGRTCLYIFCNDNLKVFYFYS